MKFAVVILAAGASTRMGRPKLLLPWREGTVLAHLVATWGKLGAARIAVVVPPESEALAGELDRLGVPASDRIENPHPQRGMFSSVRCAAQRKDWPPALTHFLLTLGDQPHVIAETLRALLDFAVEHPDRICQPARAGRPRHPVLLPHDVFLELAETSAENLKQFLLARESRRATFESGDDGLDFDLDEPADYERALRTVKAR